MSKARAFNHLVKLAGAIITHQLGDGAFAIGVESISGFAGEETAERFEEFLNGQEIESAFKNADKTIFTFRKLLLLLERDASILVAI